MVESLFRTDNEIAEIYRRHVKTVYRVCYAYMKNSADTDDAVSDTYVKMIKASPVFESGEHEKAWLIRTATNVCLDYLKHWRRRVQNIEDYSENLSSDGGFETDGAIEAVFRLPDRYKTAVYLYYYEGYTSVQISEILHKPQSTIRNYLHEARETLRKELGGDFDEG